MFDVSQYGVDTSGQDISAMSRLAGAIPVIGPLLGFGMNMIGQAMQNSKQEEFYSKYMSPQARMAQMRAAGINPNAAAQGISGSSAPQMNAAAPTSAFSSLAEALGNSVNTSLTANNIAADTWQKEVQAKGQDIQNKIAEVELGLKPSMLAAELDDLKESANQKRQAVEQSKAEVDKINAEKDKLVQEKEYLITQIGLAEYEKRLKDAETRAANAKAALDNANKELAEVNKEIQEKERDNYLTPAERIEKEAKEGVKATIDETPQGKVKKQYEQQMQKELDALEKEYSSLRGKKDIFGFSFDAQYERRRQAIIRKYRNKMRRTDRPFAAGANFAGYGLNAGG